MNVSQASNSSIRNWRPLTKRVRDKVQDQLQTAKSVEHIYPGTYKFPYKNSFGEARGGFKHNKQYFRENSNINNNMRDTTSMKAILFSPRK